MSDSFADFFEQNFALDSRQSNDGTRSGHFQSQTNIDRNKIGQNSARAKRQYIVRQDRPLLTSNEIVTTWPACLQAIAKQPRTKAFAKYSHSAT